MRSDLRRLAIVGTGLIGTSVALAARRLGGLSVAGFDADPESLAVAHSRYASSGPPS